MDSHSFRTGITETTKFICRWIILASVILTAGNSIAAQQPVIISSTDSNYQQSLVQEILVNLIESDIKPKLVGLNQPDIPDNANELIISIGNEAARYLEQNSILSTQLIILPDIDPDKTSENKNRFYLSMTQPVCQQFALIHSINNEWKTVSVLQSNADKALTQKLESCAAHYQLTLQTILIGQYVNIIDALNTSLPDSDVLLALPDASVYNSRTIKSILLTTYRHKIPVIGFSESFVHAGALAAIHSSPKQIAKKITALIKEHYSNKVINEYYIYPDDFDVTINKDVARSLGITTPERKVIIEKLKQKNNE
jgi:putative ABC transport system substrate-binding protein